MKGLLKNELLKVLSQKGYKILLVIFAIYVILLPIFNIIGDAILGSEQSAEDHYESYMESAEYYEEMEYALDAQYYRDCAGALSFFIDNNLEDWKYERMFNEDMGTIFPDSFIEESEMSSYCDFYLRARAFEYLAGGKYDAEQLYNSSYYYYLSEYFYSEDNYYYYDREWLDHSGNPIECPHTSEDIAKMKKNALEELETVSELVISCNAKEILNDYAAYATGLRESAEHNLEAKKNGGSETEIHIAERNFDIYKMAEEMFILISRECDSLDDWRVGFSISFLQAYSVHSSYTDVVVSKEEYIKELSYMYESYEKYVETTTQGIADAEAGIKVAHYAVMNNIPPEGIDTATKQNLRDNIISAADFVMIFSVVLSGTIVASEFSSGTARLLLIRPKKRWKILLSKLSCVLLFHVALIGAASILLAGLGIVFDGVGDVFANDLFYISQNVIELPSIIKTLGVITLATIQALPIISLSFLLSVLTKKSVLSFVISFVINGASSIVQTISLILITEAPFLKFTILPYLKLIDFRFTSSDLVIEEIAGGYFSLDMLFGSSLGSLLTSQTNVWLAIAIVLIHSCILCAIALQHFKKQQI